MVDLRDRRSRRMNQYQRTAELKERTEYYQRGEGLYVFRNKSGGDLELPKPTPSGMKKVGPGKEWQGDDYYMDLVRNNEAVMVKCIHTPEQTKAMKQEKEKPMNEEKLILDQPDVVTEQGTVEQVIEDPPKPLNETTPPEVEEKKDVLINEDPMEGVDILIEG